MLDHTDQEILQDYLHSVQNYGFDDHEIKQHVYDEAARIYIDFTTRSVILAILDLAQDD